MKWILILVIITLIVALNGRGPGRLMLRHAPLPAGVKWPMPQPGPQFVSSYIPAAKKFIETHRTRRGDENREQSIELTLPFEIRPDKFVKSSPRRGALLVHGLTDTPYSMRALADEFAGQGYLVRTILLPGHGTNPGHMLDIRWQDWAEAYRHGVLSFNGEVDELTLVGFSAGATLTLNFMESSAAKTGPPIRALALFSPGVRAKSPWGALADWHKIYSWAWPEGRWMDLHPDDDTMKYESFPFNAADQFYLLTKAIGDADDTNRKQKIPVFMALSGDDATIDAESAIDYFRHRTEADKRRMVWYSANGTTPNIQGVVSHPATYPDRGVISMSHLALHIKPDDDHYGEGANAYHSCLHYDPESPEDSWGRCKSNKPKGTDPDLKYGEIGTESKEGTIISRLTFNPGYSQMVDELFDFLQ